MMDWLRQLLVEPIEIHGIGRLLMLAPLILSVSLVYKTIRCRELKHVPWAATKLCTMILCGMLAIGATLFVAFRALA